MKEDAPILPDAVISPDAVIDELTFNQTGLVLGLFPLAYKLICP